MIKRYPPRKVGEDVTLWHTFYDEDGDLADVNACQITIRDASGTKIVDGAWATVVSAGLVSYRYQPLAATTGDHVVEWHAVDSEGIDFKSVEPIVWEIVERIGAFELLATEDEVPVVLPRMPVPGIHTVPSGSTVGQLVAITAAGVAETYATRAAGTPVAADAIIQEKLSDTTARLSTLTTLEGLSALTPGALLYLGVDGALTHTRSTTPGEHDQCVGRAITAMRATLWTTDPGAIVGAKLRALVEPFTIAAGAASLDVSARNDFAATNAVTQATALTLMEGQDGDQGSVHLKQDGTGYAVTFAAAGRTVVYMEGAVPTTASKQIDCSYKFVTVAGVAELHIHSSAAS